jgi:hypothetical protein
MEVQKAGLWLEGAQAPKAKQKTGSFLPFLEKAAEPVPSRIKKSAPVIAAARPQAKKAPEKTKSPVGKSPESKNLESENLESENLESKNLEGESPKNLENEENPDSLVEETQQEEGDEATEAEEDPCKAAFVRAIPIEPQFQALEAVLSFFGATAEILPEEAPEEDAAIAPALEAEIPEEKIFEGEPVAESLEPRLVYAEAEPFSKGESPSRKAGPERLTQELPATVAELINSREQAAPQELSALMPENMAVIQEAFETAESGSFGSEPDLGEAAKAVQAMALPFAEKVQAQEFAVPRQEISPADIKQIIAHATAREISPGVSEARIALHPESLGEVVLRVKSDNGVITASFTAVDPRVREMLENSLPQLKSALADQGLGVSQLSVSVGEERQQAQEEGRRRQGRYYGQEEKSEEPEKIVLGISGKNMDLAI